MAEKLIFTDVFRIADFTISETLIEPCLKMDFTKPEADKSVYIFKFLLVLDANDSSRLLLKGAYHFSVTDSSEPHPQSELTISFFSFLLQDAIHHLSDKSGRPIFVDEPWLKSQVKNALSSSLN